MELRDKKVLLVGLGILGGGLAMARFLLKKGAKLTVTDLRKAEELEPITKKLPKGIKYTLGRHSENDFRKADLIIFNPAVPFESPWVKLAKKLNKEFYNDYTFFLREVVQKARRSKPGVQSQPLIIGITGTRGKTTTSIWINHLIPGSVLGGNIPEKNLLKISNAKTDVYVLELSSFQLEYADKDTPSPNIAVLTNLYIDHLNRYGNFDAYRDIKFNIFNNQNEKDALILNADEAITGEILKQKPKAKLFFISKKKLPKQKNGMYFGNDTIFYIFEGKISKVAKVNNLAPHEKTNLLTAMLAAHLVGVSGEEIVERIKNLPSPIFRQQMVFKNNEFTVINDSSATSPDAPIAAIEKYKKSKNLILIAGGTDKELDFADLAKKIKSDVRPEKLYLLEGSGTNKLIKELRKIGYIKGEYEAYENLEEIVDVLSQEFENGTIVLSPAAASFEKFKNEFDRGQKFNKLVGKYYGKTDTK